MPVKLRLQVFKVSAIHYIKTRVYSSNGQEIDRQELSNEETLAPVTVAVAGTAKLNMVPNEAIERQP